METCWYQFKTKYDFSVHLENNTFFSFKLFMSVDIVKC